MSIGRRVRSSAAQGADAHLGAFDDVDIVIKSVEQRLGAYRGLGILRLLWRDRTSRVGLVIVLFLLAICLFGPALAPHDPLSFGPARLSPPSRANYLGTDRLGRDILSRLLYGARLSLGTAFLASVIIVCIGVTVGCVTGFVGGWLDSVVMRLVDVILAFPSLILALAIAGLFGGSLRTLLVSLAAVWWAGYARIVRGLVLSLRERDFVEAARSIGASESRIVLRHVVPNLLSPVIVLATLEMGTLILAIASLNFLGLGVQPPTPEWGAMVNDGRNFLFSAPHVILIPGLSISLTVLGFNLLGDGFRDVLDPKLQRSV